MKPVCEISEETKTMIPLAKANFKGRSQLRAICVPKHQAHFISKVLCRAGIELILPEGGVVAAAFLTLGHTAHRNLTQEVFPTTRMDGAGEGERVSLREANGSAVGNEGDGATGVGAGAVEPQWLTVDGPLGVDHEQASKLARKFFFGGFCLLPWLWFANCFYFWPLRKNRQADPLTHGYIVWSGVGCLAVTVILLAWSVTFVIGGEKVLGSSWKHLVVYNLADKYGMAWAQ